MTQTQILNQETQKAFESENLNRDIIAKILGTTVYDKAFFFYEEVGKPTGEYAVSLVDFCSKTEIVPAKSLGFHLKRGDFEKWIRDVIGDVELSHRLNNLKTNKSIWKKEVALKNNIHATVRDRVVELQDLWHQAVTWPTRS